MGDKWSSFPSFFQSLPQDGISLCIFFGGVQSTGKTGLQEWEIITRNVLDNIRCSNICVIGTQEGEEGNYS